MEKLDISGIAPQSRFGHTMTSISENKAVLFGGATGNTGKYAITGDIYSFDIVTRYWKKIEASGNSPSPRAAHAAAAIERNQLVIYGGSTGAGCLASDDLFLLDFKDGEDKAVWTTIPVVGATPGRRYGHVLTYAKPYLVVFGGNTGTEPVNDTWCLSVEKGPFTWQKLECKSEAPCPRVYHSAALCRFGPALGMIVVFGGRSGDQVALNDSWGLRRHRNGVWDWVKAPYKADADHLPLARYQHSSIFLGSVMIILGGRTNNNNNSIGMEVYDTGTSEWFKISTIQKFRHASWIVENFMYVYGGFDNDSPNVPTDAIVRLNLAKLFQQHESLLQQAQSFLVTKTKPHSNPESLKPSPDTSMEILDQKNRSVDYGKQQQQQQNYTGVKPKNKENFLPANLVTGRFDRFADQAFRFANVHVAVSEQTKGVEDIVKKQIPMDKFTESSKKGGNNKAMFATPLSGTSLTNTQNIAAFFLK